MEKENINEFLLEQNNYIFLIKIRAYFFLLFTNGYPKLKLVIFVFAICPRISNCLVRQFSYI